MDFSALIEKEIAKKKQNANKSGVTSKIIKKSELAKKKELEYAEKQKSIELEKAKLRRIKEEERQKEQEKNKQRRLKFAERLKSCQKNEIDAQDNTSLSADELKKQIKQIDSEQETDNLTDNQLRHLLTELEERIQLEKEIKEESEVDFAIEPGEIASNSSKVYIQMRAYIKYLLLEWQEIVTGRNENDSTMQEEEQDKIDRTSAAIFNEVLADIEPLMVMLRSRSLPNDIYPTLATLLMYLQQKKFTEANTTYISLSIGNAAWPIGVLAVGIHQRSALSRITGISGESPNANVANIVKDEKTKKWILSVKRLISFSECYLG